MLRRFVFLLGMSCTCMMSASLVAAQQVRSDTCATGEAEAYLDINNVRARLMNTGNLFWNGSPDVYEVPQGSGVNSIFTAGFWIGGLVGDSLHIAAARYRDYEFWPGPLDMNGQPPRVCESYDRIYTIRRDHIAYYEQTGVVLPELADWPAHLDAPVLDGDGDPSNYNVADGDRPALLGDEMSWWVMNDRGGVHRSTGSEPVGVEVRVSAFGFDVAGALSNTTFYRYQVKYRGDEPLERAYIGFFMDPDLGNFDDDYIASDTTLMMGYVYNADDDDEGEYGAAPPALGVSVLQGPVAEVDGKDNDRDGQVDEAGERLEMTAFVYFNNSGNVQGDPTRGIEYYNYMQAKWKDGQPFTFGGDGRSGSKEPFSFVYPGDPTTHSYWTEVINGYASLTPSDRRFVVATGPFRLESDEEEDVVFAIVWSRGSDHLDSIRKLRQDMAFVQERTSDIMTSRSFGQATPAAKAPSLQHGYNRNYPNPFAEQTTIGYQLAQPAQVRLVVYTLLGQEVAVLVDGERGVGRHEAVFDGSGLAPGVYMYRLQIGEQVATEPMMLMP